MEYKNFSDFEDFALESISRHLNRTFDDSYADYNRVLSSKHRAVFKEIRENIHNPFYSQDELTQYTRFLWEKMQSLRNSLFLELQGSTTYLLDGIILNDSLELAMNCVRSLFQMVDSLYNLIHHFFDQYNSVFDTTQKNTSREKGPRIPDRGSFLVKHPEVNFQAIHTKLIGGKHPFIDPTTSWQQVAKVFQGVNNVDKIVWNNANSLRYFIRELYKNKLIEGPNEGKWRRTIQCFKPLKGEFTPEDFQDTKDPVAGITFLLDEIIELFSR